MAAKRVLTPAQQFPSAAFFSQPAEISVLTPAKPDSPSTVLLQTLFLPVKKPFKNTAKAC